jgi:hypothetical protein
MRRRANRRIRTESDREGWRATSVQASRWRALGQGQWRCYGRCQNATPSGIDLAHRGGKVVVNFTTRFSRYSHTPPPTIVLPRPLGGQGLVLSAMSKGIWQDDPFQWRPFVESRLALASFYMGFDRSKSVLMATTCGCSPSPIPCSQEWREPTHPLSPQAKAPNSAVENSESWKN